MMDRQSAKTRIELYFQKVSAIFKVWHKILGTNAPKTNFYIKAFTASF